MMTEDEIRAELVGVKTFCGRSLKDGGQPDNDKLLDEYERLFGNCKRAKKAGQDLRAPYNELLAFVNATGCVAWITRVERAKGLQP